MSRAKVLVVDDEADIVEIVRANLESAGYEVASAQTGSEALRWLKRIHPDLVVLDVLLPEVDGWELLRMIRHDDRIADTPVVMLTCLTDEAAVLRGLADGAIEYVTKPFEPSSLVASVQTLLEDFDPTMREERRERLLSSQRRKLDVAQQPLMISSPIYTRSNVEVPLDTRRN